jgi:hypothetical protein
MTEQRTKPNAEPFRILPSHERVLHALVRYDRLTAEQVRRLLYGKGSLTYAQPLLKTLFEHGYLYRVAVGRPGPEGSGPYVYTLDRRGRALLQSLGVDVSRRLRQSEEKEHSSPHLRHSVAVVDVLILHELLCRDDARVSLARMVGERALKGLAVKVTMPSGRRRGVAMDAWVDLRIPHPNGRVRQLCLGYEVDGGTEWQVAWRTKIQALLAYEAGPYGQVFGVGTPLVIVVVAPDDARATQLRGWTAQELAAQGAEQRADLFRFGAMPHDLADARSFFFSPRWRIPGQDAPVPLITGL